jgi:DNA mismatch endonuclease, patch repair protein
MLARMRLRGWQRNHKSLLGHPDVVFEQERVVIFIDGCFWHGCPTCRRKLPKTNREYWERKLGRNVNLARSYNRSLRRNGWTVIRIWEHEMRTLKLREKIRTRILKALGRITSDSG